ncbi:hypothetical protein BH20ACT2_BH20ACT2_12050 [soil metagenome]
MMRPFVPPHGSVLDPLVAEVTWVAYEPSAARPEQMSDRTVAAVTGAFDRLVEVTWQPGRAGLISEVELTTDPVPRVAVRLAVGHFGPQGTTAGEADGSAALIGEALHPSKSPYQLTGVDPTTLFEMPGACGAVIRQRTVSVGDGEDDIEVLSRFFPTIEPWTSVTGMLFELGRPVRVRATLLATELGTLDRINLDAAVVSAVELRARLDGRPHLAAQVDRALATLTDLHASFTTPLYLGEVAVTSTEPLAESFLRGIAGAFTGELDVCRSAGATAVASAAHLMGGFEIERDPARLADAHVLGLPLRGGLCDHALRDLMTLRESPIGWPLPLRGPIPTVSAVHPVASRVPPGLAEGTVVGRTIGGGTLRIPDHLRDRHLLVLGVPGTGKSTVATRLALADLEAGRGFCFVDPHGPAADRLVAAADAAGVDALVLDAADRRTARIAPVPRLRRDGRNHDAVMAATATFCDAIASSYPDAEWTGPRWRAIIRSLLELSAAHGADLEQAVEWLLDPDLLRGALDQPTLGGVSRGNLASVTSSLHRDGPELREWAAAKLVPLATGPARHLLAAPGRGTSIARAVAEGRPVIVNLAALATDDGGLVGHLMLAAVLDAAMALGGDTAGSVGGRLYPVYVDEAHRFPVRALGRILAEGRKFGIGLTLATQALHQLPPEMVDAVVGGTAVKVLFRLTPDSAHQIGPATGVPPDELVDLPDLRATIKVAGLPACTVTVPPYDPHPPLRTKLPPLPRRRRRRKQAEPSTPTPNRASLLDDLLAGVKLAPPDSAT